MSPEEFGSKLNMLVAGELARCRGDGERMASLYEALARSLGLAIAVGAHGLPHVIDELVVGTEAYVHEEAVERSDIARFLSGIRA